LESFCNFYEIERLRQMSIFEKTLTEKGYQNIAGIDEAGRGPLAGPLVVSACILPKGFFLDGLNDSKKVSKGLRKLLYKKLINNSNVVYASIYIDEKTIDQMNIFQATMYGMAQVTKLLKVKPDYLLVDGNQLPDIPINKEAIVAGDMYSISIAAASIIAKEERDDFMKKMQKKYPNFTFEKHKGYATKQHIKEIELYGPTPIHRKSFEPVKSIFRSLF
jgi:ribonuclease HII